jgi:flagellar biosynthesis GTPase FlhF
MSRLIRSLDLDQEQKQKPNVILDDYLDLIRCSYPYCNCGKCISKKLAHKSPNHKYNDLGSMYKKDHNWKENEKKEENETINRNKIHEKNTVKNNNLKDALLSEMRREKNKNTKIEEKENNKNLLRENKNEKINGQYETNLRNSQKGNNINEINDKDHRPFIGRSNYDTMFPNWKLLKNAKDEAERKPWENIPFISNSNYQEKFIRHNNDVYADKRSPIMNYASLEQKGESIQKEGAYKELFKPIDYQNFKEINYTPKKRGDMIVSGPYSKNSFLSSYEKAFMYNNLSVKKDRGTLGNFII